MFREREEREKERKRNIKKWRAQRGTRQCRPTKYLDPSGKRPA